MKHTILATIMLVALTFSADAYDFQSGDLCYNITSDTEPYTVEVIGEFFSYRKLTAVTIPATVTYNSKEYSVTSIGNDAFNRCSGLTSVTFAENSKLTSIGYNAFYLCKGLTSVTIPNSVTSIGYYAFYCCEGLTLITIPNSVTSIGSEAFKGCSNLTSVNIPNTVTSIDNNAFYGIRHINYNGSATGSPWGAITMNGITDGDIVYTNTSKDTIIAYIGTGSDVAIPNSVKSIGKDAFNGCNGLTSITIPNSITSIGIYAFRFCSGLTSVTFAEGSELKSIGDYAFDGCSGLTSITIPNSVTSIGSSAFNGCSGLTSVTFAENSKLTSISSNAFSGCSGLTSITIPNSVTSIGSSAFYDCSGLKFITIPNSVTSIGDRAFSNAKHIIYNGSATGSPWGAIAMNGITDGDIVYTNTSKDTIIAYIGTGSDVAIPNSVTSIGSNAFSGCSGLRSITFTEDSKLTSIGKDAFNGCSGLTSITIPNSMTSIDRYAFNGCSGLTSITIPNSVTSIDRYAFSGCSGLVSVTIPNSVTSIGAYAFRRCSGLTSVTFAENSKLKSIGDYVFDDCSGLTSIAIPNSVTSIDRYAFRRCSGLTSVTFAENSKLKSIGENAFYQCSNLKSITIPNSVKSIGENAFNGCSGLTSVSIPNSVTSIGSDAFRGCTASIIYCQATKKPSGWAGAWNPDSRPVVWGCKVVSLSANDNTFGTVTSDKDGLFEPNEYVTISAIPAKHCHFVKWSDNNNNNSSRTIKVTTDTTLIAVFAIDTFKVNTFAENGTVSGTGAYTYGTQTSLTATPAKHYHFAKWSDGDTKNPRSITITSDTTLTAVFAIDTLKVTASAENGTVFGAGEFAYGASILLVATPAKHYHFAKWSDGDTKNPRSITITSDMAFTAMFAIDTLKVTASAENGNVFGTGEFAYGTSASLTATPAEHYHFAKWSDGSTENPRSITVTSDMAFTAMFAIDTLKVTASAENGTVFGAGEFAYGTSILLGAIPAEHYHFAKWSDGDTKNPRSITVTENITLEAIFKKADDIDTLKVTASAENGTVFGTGEFAYGTSILLVATPAEHYHFAKWSDENTENPRTITVTEDITLIAIFEKADAIDTLKVTASAENGTVFGAGEFAYGTSILLGAIPAEHYHFAKWSDGDTKNPRTITVTENITLEAIFEKADDIDTLKVTAFAENGTVSGAGEFAYGTSILLGATPAEHYHFAKWSDGNTENPRSIKVTSDTTLIAVFAIDTLKVTAFAENGTVSGAGLYAYSTQTSLTATPAENYHFVKWSDGNTENPRSITVTEDITLIAIFEKADAISTDAVADVKIYAHHNVIVVENATDDIYVYDAMGRLIARNSDSNRNAVHHGSTEITMQNTGIYIVKVGNETKRVMVW